ncbi:MAG: SIS domain-containing protein [Bacillota bacterium]
MNSQFIKNYLFDVGTLVQKIPVEEIETVIISLLDCVTKGNKIFFIGNGGSASTASHLACDLGKGARSQGGLMIRAIALTDNIPVITAWANDTSYENIFCEQLRPLASAGDVLVAISGSGNSANVIRAVEYANSAGLLTIGLAGFDGGLLYKQARLCILVPSDNMQQVEDAHTVLCHLIASYIREALKNEGGVS